MLGSSRAARRTRRAAEHGLGSTKRCPVAPGHARRAKRQGPSALPDTSETVAPTPALHACPGCRCACCSRRSVAASGSVPGHPRPRRGGAATPPPPPPRPTRPPLTRPAHPAPPRPPPPAARAWRALGSRGGRAGAPPPAAPPARGGRPAPPPPRRARRPPPPGGGGAGAFPPPPRRGLG